MFCRKKLHVTLILLRTYDIKPFFFSEWDEQTIRCRPSQGSHIQYTEHHWYRAELCDRSHRRRFVRHWLRHMG